ncbi:MAG TPA: cobalt ECF transporter T component CbiQ [Methanomassiliicoccales archaeon]
MSEHDELDRFATRSTLYRFDPRVKLASTIFLVVVTALLQNITALLFILAFVLILSIVSRVPMHHIGENFILAVPFIIFAAITVFLTSNPWNALAMAVRISASVLALILLVSTTPFFEMMSAFRWFRMPKLLAILILFTYRFIFILRDESDRMKMARKARGFSGGKHLFEKRAFQTISNTVGMVFVRSSQRATDIYDALLTRGYSGNVRTLRKSKVGAKDAVFASMFVLVCLSSIMLQHGGSLWNP